MLIISASNEPSISYIDLHTLKDLSITAYNYLKKLELQINESLLVISQLDPKVLEECLKYYKKAAEEVLRLHSAKMQPWRFYKFPGNLVRRFPEQGPNYNKVQDIKYQFNELKKNNDAFVEKFITLIENVELPKELKEAINKLVEKLRKKNTIKDLIEITEEIRKLSSLSETLLISINMQDNTKYVNILNHFYLVFIFSNSDFIFSISEIIKENEQFFKKLVKDFPTNMNEEEIIRKFSFLPMKEALSTIEKTRLRNEHIEELFILINQGIEEQKSIDSMQIRNITEIQLSLKKIEPLEKVEKIKKEMETSSKGNNKPIFLKEIRKILDFLENLNNNEKEKNIKKIVEELNFTCFEKQKLKDFFEILNEKNKTTFMIKIGKFLESNKHIKGYNLKSFLENREAFLSKKIIFDFINSDENSQKTINLKLLFKSANLTQHEKILLKFYLDSLEKREAEEKDYLSKKIINFLEFLEFKNDQKKINIKELVNDIKISQFEKDALEQYLKTLNEESLNNFYFDLEQKIMDITRYIEKNQNNEKLKDQLYELNKKKEEAVFKLNEEKNMITIKKAIEYLDLLDNNNFDIEEEVFMPSIEKNFLLMHSLREVVTHLQEHSKSLEGLSNMKTVEISIEKVIKNLNKVEEKKDLEKNKIEQYSMEKKILINTKNVFVNVNIKNESEIEKLREICIGFKFDPLNFISKENINLILNGVWNLSQFDCPNTQPEEMNYNNNLVHKEDPVPFPKRELTSEYNRNTIAMIESFIELEAMLFFTQEIERIVLKNEKRKERKYWIGIKEINKRFDDFMQQRNNKNNPFISRVIISQFIFIAFVLLLIIIKRDNLRKEEVELIVKSHTSLLETL